MREMLLVPGRCTVLNRKSTSQRKERQQECGQDHSRPPRMFWSALLQARANGASKVRPPRSLREDIW